MCVIRVAITEVCSVFHSRGIVFEWLAFGCILIAAIGITHGDINVALYRTVLNTKSRSFSPASA